MRGEPFVAAYSEHPFYEDTVGALYPDYAFEKSGGLYFCVRVGEIEIPWGFGDPALGFGANGTVIVRRRNVGADSLRTMGIPFTRVDDIHYAFINHITDGGLDGFTKYLEPRMLPIIREYAASLGFCAFAEQAGDRLARDGRLIRLFDEHEMSIVSLSVRSVIGYGKNELKE